MRNMKLTAAESTALPYAKFPHDAFSRPDESDDKVFYARDRFVQHLDTLRETGGCLTG
jgi:hypothetical protein